MKLRLQLFFDSLRYSYMTVPMFISLCGLALALITLKLDANSLSFDGDSLGARVSSSLLYSGGADGARALLGAIAGSIISVAALASSIAITALALASGQFGSRLLRTFMDDRGFQIALGTFNGTFLFCLVVLRGIRSADEGAGFGSGVPEISVTSALGLAVICVFLLIYFLHHMAQAIQAPYVIADAAHDLNVEIERLFGEGKSAKHGACATDEQHQRIENDELPDFDLGIDIEATKDGFLRAVDYDILLRIAIKENAIFKLGYGSGDWVVRGDPLLTVWPPRNPMIYEEKAQRCFLTGRSRTTVQDAEYGFNQLVEVGARALSPGINDPFTAITCLGHIGAALRHILRCEIPSPYLLDEEGNLRIITHTVTFPSLCDSGFDMIRHYGADSPKVILSLLETLAEVGAKCKTDEQRAAIVHHAKMAREEASKASVMDSDKASYDVAYAKVLRSIAEREEQR